ncbi:hypothetical protein PSU4_39890 [Pseudonocardia sulfidoxydans NBRC 16205]|uniref:Ferric siderophore reductase C-terminal domain-containing protein n=1 Tax=Pseudonocardia sulfidoxydans NBRC 16205 TaxID=1223511 RepID=A0A511DJQ1_9PSEU|nr:hypothetical protein PSU4_39890 [Pseudonocardia sulfidoxydans NBRC 16205]
MHDQILRAPLSAVRLRVYGGVIEAATFSEPPYAGVGDIAADDEAMLTDLIDRNLSVLASRLRTQIRISSRTLSGNIAAAIATGTRVMSWCATPDDQVADASFAAAFALRLLRRRNLDHLCDVDIQTVEDRSWLVVQRRSCCLAYRTPAASYCATCPLISRSDRTDRHRRMILDHIQESR